MSKKLDSLFLSYYSNFSSSKYSLESFERIFGGASRETYKIKVTDNKGIEERLVLRLSQDSSLIETEQKTEYLASVSYTHLTLPTILLV